MLLVQALITLCLAVRIEAVTLRVSTTRCACSSIIL
jgi:hypothetical protein